MLNMRRFRIVGLLVGLLAMTVLGCGRHREPIPPGAQALPAARVHLPRGSPDAGKAPPGQMPRAAQVRRSVGQLGSYRLPPRSRTVCSTYVPLHSNSPQEKEKFAVRVLPPANLPLSGITSADHVCVVPSQVPKSKNSPNPRTTNRPTFWRASTVMSMNSPFSQEYVPETVATPVRVLTRP